MSYVENEADKDQVTVMCLTPKCGNEFNMPWDATVMGGLEPGGCMYCGPCGKNNGYKVIADPAKNLPGN